MLVAFVAHAVLTEPLVGGQSQFFPRHILESQEPFQRLSVVGGRNKWVFSGVLNIRKLKQRKRIAYEVAAALVPKVEEITKVGIETLDFEKIDPQHTE